MANWASGLRLHMKFHLLMDSKNSHNVSSYSTLNSLLHKERDQESHRDQTTLNKFLKPIKMKHDPKNMNQIEPA